MTYPGDSKLSEAIQERVQSTYKQSRELASQGKSQEATLGCEFVLRLDPLFEPARELMRRIEAGETVAPDAAGSSAPEEPAVTAAPKAPAAPDFELESELSDLLDVRDFRTLLNLAKEHSDAVATDPAIAKIVAAANERLEAEPYVRSFVESAEKAQRQGRQEEALALLEKARALDPSHPGLPTAKYEPVEDESNERIRELLAEGQRSLDRGDFQGAIDSWSRIFLIDIDHAEANRRIEDARRRKAENERKIEEAFHEGVSLWEIGTTDKAREQFEKVLGLDSSHPGARDYIERMDAREESESSSPRSSSPGGAQLSEDAEILAPPDEPPPVPPPPAETEEFGDLLDLDGDEAETAAPAGAKAGGLGGRRFLTIGGIVVLVLVAALAILYLKRDAFFPNSGEEATPGAEVDVLARARKLQEAGSTTMAIAQLKQLETSHPQYAEAQAMIAQWEAPPAPEPEPEEPSDEDLARRDVLVSRAQQARQEQEYIRAATFYERAAQLAPLEEEDRLLHAEVQQRLAGLEGEIELFRQGDWEFVLPELWKLHAANPEDRDVRRLMVDSYYNLGVRDLQRGDTAQAQEKFTRANELDPEDADVERLLRFADAYSSRPADLLFKIFVKYLRFR